MPSAPAMPRGPGESGTINPVKRRLFNLLAGLSLLLLVVTLARWPYSFTSYDDLSFDRHTDGVNRRLGISCHWGDLGVYSYSVSDFRTAVGLHWQHLSMKGALSIRYQGVIFQFMGIHLTRTANGHGLFLPLWMIAVFTAIPPLLWIRHRRQEALLKRRSDAQLCPTCGYDLRANPARCPECGTVPVKAVESTA